MKSGSISYCCPSHWSLRNRCGAFRSLSYVMWYSLYIIRYICLCGLWELFAYITKPDKRNRFYLWSSLFMIGVMVVLSQFASDSNAINFPFKPNASIIELILGFFMCTLCSKRYYLNHSVGLRRLLIVPLAILLLFVYAIFGAQNIDGTSL